MPAQAIEPQTSESAQPARRDFRQDVTNQIIAMLEKGVAPWQKPWEPSAPGTGMPENPSTGKLYRGGNAIHLLATGLQRGYDDPRWMTYNQAKQEGWQVRKGKKGTQIEFWNVKPGSAGKEGEEDGTEQPARDTLIQRVYTVFNAKQIDGIPAREPKRPTQFELIQTGEDILEGSGACIQHDQADCAFYNRASDSIHLPPKEAFKDVAGYYGTALHELAHNAASGIMPDSAAIPKVSSTNSLCYAA
jgi:antirestriction protein ArdC